MSYCAVEGLLVNILTNDTSSHVSDGPAFVDWDEHTMGWDVYLTTM